MKTQSNAEAVREFTKGAGQPAPDAPQPMTKKDVFFLAKMMLDEVRAPAKCLVRHQSSYNYS